MTLPSRAFHKLPIKLYQKEVIMETLRKALLVVVLLSAIVSTSFEFLQAARAACPVTCPDLGCTGGLTLCAQFECNGVLVQCFTTPPKVE
jgi:hypothetical protein